MHIFQNLITTLKGWPGQVPDHKAQGEIKDLFLTQTPTEKFVTKEKKEEMEEEVGEESRDREGENRNESELPAASVFYPLVTMTTP